MRTKLVGNELDKLVRQAISESGLSLLEISKRGGLPYAVVHGLANGRQVQLNTAGRILTGLGLVAELKPKGR